MELALAFHTEDPDGVGDILNIFSLSLLFPFSRFQGSAPCKKVGGGTMVRDIHLLGLRGDPDGPT